MSAHPRILIVGRDDAQAAPLAEGLDRLGLRTVTARSAGAAMVALADFSIEAAVIDVADGETALALAEQLKAAVTPRQMPVIAISLPDPQLQAHGFDFAIAPPLHPAQAALRLQAALRTAVAEEELILRRQTFAEAGGGLAVAGAAKTPVRVLAIGEPAPQFLALANALKAQDVDVVGAFTAYTAFDYLHERPFDAVVLWAGDNRQEALSIAAGLRRNTRLYHIPALLYLKTGTDVTAAEAFHRGVSDIASPQTPETETAARIIELAKTFRRGEAVREGLSDVRAAGLTDPATGLFTREIFAAHLARQAAAAQERGRPLSVCVLRIADRSETLAARAGGWLDKAAPQIGSMIGRLVRCEDAAARLAPEVFAIAFPATNESQARAAAERIAAVVSCTAFDAGEDKKPFVCDFDIGVAQVKDAEDAARALERAARGVLSQAG